MQPVVRSENGGGVTRGPRLRAVRAEDAGVDAQQWDAIVDRSDTATLYHTWDWLQAMCRGLKARLLPVAWLDATGEVVALLPVAVRRFGPITAAQSPIRFGTAYGGPACRSEDLAGVVGQLSEIRRLVRYNYLAVTLPPGIPAVNPPVGFQSDTHKTPILRLSRPEAELWAGANRLCRRKVKAAQQANLRVSTEPFSDHLDVYMRWSEEAFGAHGKAQPIPRAFYEAIATEVDAENLRFFVARSDAAPLAMTLVGRYHRTMYSLAAAMDRSAATSGASNLVWWEAIRWGNRAGLEEFDMIGADVPSIAFFKVGFGAKTVLLQAFEFKDRLSRLALASRKLFARETPA